MEDLLERIAIMIDKEINLYATEDYLAPEFQQKLSSVPQEDDVVLPPTTGAAAGTGSVSSSATSVASSGINEIWREKICEWSYQVIDHFEFSREVVNIAIHYLDRYLATRTVNKKIFQLAAMTCLFIAIKLFEPGRLSMLSMIELSRGYFTVEQMAAMEMSILKALSWHVHPPTAYCFAKHILYVLPYASVTMDVRYDILEHARFLTELSVIDYYFVIHRPSAVALAALLNAMEEVSGVLTTARTDLIRAIQKIPGFDASASDVLECRNRLRLLYAQGGYSRPIASSAETRNETTSPICVSHGCMPPSSRPTQNQESKVGSTDQGIYPSSRPMSSIPTSRSTATNSQS